MNLDIPDATDKALLKLVPPVLRGRNSARKRVLWAIDELVGANIAPVNTKEPKARPLNST